jgi:hypothetical protein
MAESRRKKRSYDLGRNYEGKLIISPKNKPLKAGEKKSIPRIMRENERFKNERSNNPRDRKLNHSEGLERMKTIDKMKSKHRIKKKK